MPSLKAASIWRVIRDIDLDAIRRETTARFALVAIGDEAGDAARLAELLTTEHWREPGSGHPWIAVGEAERGVPPLPQKPAAALLVSRAVEPIPALAAARDALSAAGVPVVMIVVGSPHATSDGARQGEAARVGVPVIDSGAATAVAAALLAAAVPGVHPALGRQLGALRPLVFRSLVEETANANATFALTTGLAETVPVLTAPLNLGDIVILTKNQLLLCYRLALVAGRDGDPKRMIAEMLGVLGGGLLFRQAARQLVGLIPVAGLLPKVAIAYAGTWAIGRAMIGWLTEGREITPQTVASFTAEGLARGREVARRLLDQARSRGEHATRRLDTWRRQLPWIVTRRPPPR